MIGSAAREIFRHQIDALLSHIRQSREQDTERRRRCKSVVAQMHGESGGGRQGPQARTHLASPAMAAAAAIAGEIVDVRNF